MSRCTVDFDFEARISSVWRAIFNVRCVDLILRLINLAVYSESNNILSFRSYFHFNEGTFLKHPGVYSLELEILNFSGLILRPLRQ